MDKEIDYLLTKADLSNYTDNFKQIGVAKVKHFLDVDDETLEQDIGLTKIQTRRLGVSSPRYKANQSKEEQAVKVLSYLFLDDYFEGLYKIIGLCFKPAMNKKRNATWCIICNAILNKHL